MARYWTSPNSCAYVDDYVYATINFPQPVPEPDMDKLFEKLLTIARRYAIDRGGAGIFNKRYRIDEDDLCSEDNPIATINGVDYVTYTGNIQVMTNCEDGDAGNFTSEIEDELRQYNARVTQIEIVGNY